MSPHVVEDSCSYQSELDDEGEEDGSGGSQVGVDGSEVFRVVTNIVFTTSSPDNMMMVVLLQLCKLHHGLLDSILCCFMIGLHNKF